MNNVYDIKRRYYCQVKKWALETGISLPRQPVFRQFLYKMVGFKHRLLERYGMGIPKLTEEHIFTRFSHLFSQVDMPGN
jgi:hypothetical protein